MIKITNNEIIDLLSKGYKKEILAFEFDLPIEIVEKCAYQVDQNKIYKNQNVIYSPEIEIIIQKYNKLNSNTNNTIISQQINQKELTSINEIEEKILGIKNVNNRNKVLKQIKTDLENSTLTFEQCNRLAYIIANIDKRSFKYIEVKECERVKIILDLKLFDAIKRELNNAKSTEETKKILEKCNFFMKNNCENSIVLKGIKYQIEKKIETLNQEITIQKAKNTNSTEILKIVSQISEGIFDIDNINKVIDEKIKSELENKPINKFGSFTQKQEKERIFIQINHILINKAEQYPIKDAYNTIEFLQKLFGNLENSVRTVAMNFTNRGEFEMARKICEKYSKTNVNIEIPYVRLIKIDIRNAEIKNEVHKILNREYTPEEANKVLKLIQLKVNLGEIKGSSIILGKTSDGRNITLEDICTKELNIKIR